MKSKIFEYLDYLEFKRRSCKELLDIENIDDLLRARLKRELLVIDEHTSAFNDIFELRKKRMSKSAKVFDFIAWAYEKHGVSISWFSWEADFIKYCYENLEKAPPKKDILDVILDKRKEDDN